MQERKEHEAELDSRPFGQFWLAASPQERYAGYLDMTGKSPRVQRWPLLVNSYRDSLERFFSGMFNPIAGIIEEFLSAIAACEELDRVVYGTNKSAELVARLRRLCKSIPGLVAEHAPDGVLEQIKESRHYYAHALGKKSSNAARDFLLKRYTLFLKRLYAAHLFRLMGISDERIVEIVMEKYEWREALALRAFPNAR